MNLNEMVEAVLKRAGKGEPLSTDDFLILLLDRISLLNLSDKLNSPFSYLPRTDPNLRVRKILLIMLSEIGDVVCSTSSLKTLREIYPESFISFLVEEDAYPVVEDNPYLDEVILFPAKHWNIFLNKGGDFKKVLEELSSLILDLKEREYDYVLNLHLSLRSALVTCLASGKYVSGFSLKEDGSPLMCGNLWNFYDWLPVRNQRTKWYAWMNYAEHSLRKALLEPERREVNFFISRKKEERVRAILDRLGIGEKDLLIGLNPGSNYPARRWLPERFAALADTLIREFGAKVIIFGGPDDVGIAEGIIKTIEEEIINLAGKTNLWELAGIITRCDHFITNDTGPMHIAGAVRTKTVAINGPTRVGPYGHEGHLVLQANISCVNCGALSACTKGDCMRAIEIKDVLAALKYQRGEIELSALSHQLSDRVNAYTSGKEPLTRLSEYYPLKAYAPGEIVNDLIRFGRLSLWIQENNRLGFKERPLSLEEVNRELIRKYPKEAFKEAVKYVKDNIKMFEKYREDIKKQLINFEPESLTSLDPWIEKFFDLFHFLFIGKDYSRERLLKFYKWKVEAALSLENFLKSWIDHEG